MVSKEKFIAGKLPTFATIDQKKSREKQMVLKQILSRHIDALINSNQIVANLITSIHISASLLNHSKSVSVSQIYMGN